MQIRTVRRGFAALAIAATLGLAGAYPAAAAETGWVERGLSWLAGLWGADDAAGPHRPGPLLSGPNTPMPRMITGADGNGNQALLIACNARLSAERAASCNASLRVG